MGGLAAEACWIIAGAGVGFQPLFNHKLGGRGVGGLNTYNKDLIRPI